jgi:putative transposase
MLPGAMPRANRYIQKGHVYHVTDRCHDRSFLLKFGVDRNAYRKQLRLALRGSGVSLLGHCITSNHTHLLATARKPRNLSEFMQKLKGDFGQWYNLRKHRSGAFWNGRFHCTMIESGRHLWNCMTYIDLNMVRAGVVGHPREWRWCGHDELVGSRKQHLVLDRAKVLEIVEGGDWEDFNRDYAAAVEAALDRGRLGREPWWTESIAVGSREYVLRIAERARKRMRLEVQEAYDGAWMVCEPEAVYGDPSGEHLQILCGQESGLKIERAGGIWCLKWA